VLADRPALPEHCALETLSVLTRLPAPHRMAAGDVARWLAARFDDAYLCLPGHEVARLIRELATDGISGGAAYDALVAATAARADAVLVSLDRRAAITYRRLGARFRLLPSGESAGPLA
jgi:predicted nucleic acid-binding protein